MADRHETMMNPRVEDLLDRTHSKFGLVTLASRRARNINSYFGQLADGLGASVPPQVTSVARKPLSIAFEEIAADKIVPIEEDLDVVDAVDTVDAVEEAEELTEAVDEGKESTED